MIAAPDGKGDRMRANTVLVVRALLLGVLTSIALAALSVLLQPELSKYSLLVSKLNFVFVSGPLYEAVCVYTHHGHNNPKPETRQHFSNQLLDSMSTAESLRQLLIFRA